MNPQPKPIDFADFNFRHTRSRVVRGNRGLGVTRGAVNIPIQNTVRPMPGCGPAGLALHATENDILHDTFYKVTEPAHGQIASNSPDRFCFAPLEERVLLVGRHTNPALVKESKFELFCLVNRQLKKMWTKTYTWKPGTCPEFVRGLFSGDLGPVDAPAEKRRYPNALAGVTVDTDGGLMTSDFPDNVVTVARSPYMLRFTVTPLLPGTPITEPAVWLYFDILAHSVSLEWGAVAMIPPAKRTDIESRFHDETVRLEKDVTFDELKKANPDPMAATHEVILDSNHVGGAEVAAVLRKETFTPDRKGHGGAFDLSLVKPVFEDVTFPSGTALETKKGEPMYVTAEELKFTVGTTGPKKIKVTCSGQPSQLDLPAPKKVLLEAATDFKAYEAKWGQGPRIPIVAKIRVKRSDRMPSTTDPALKAVGPAECLWDWEDKSDTKMRDWMGAADTDSTASTRYFLGETMKGEPGDVDAAPLNATNCPVKYGGKRGAGAAPVFLQTEQGGFPYALAPAGGNRPWAGISKCGTGVHAGKTGVLFQPSRMMGDRYRLVVYVVVDRADFDVKDTAPDQTLRAQVMALPANERPAMGVSGLFEVFRRAKLNYYSFPANTPGSEKIHDAVTAYKKVAGTILDLTDHGAPPASFTETARFNAAYKALYEGDGDVQLFIHHLFVQPQPLPDATHFLHTRNHAEYTAAMRDHFKQKPMFAVTLSDGGLFERSGEGGGTRFVEVSASGGAKGFVVALDTVLTEELDVPVYLLLALDNTPFRAGDTLTTKDAKPLTTRIKKVLTEASGFVSVAYKMDTGNPAQQVDVDIAGTAVRLIFPKKTFSSSYSKQLTTDHKKRLRAAMLQVVNGRQTHVTVRIQGNVANQDGGLRMSRVRGYLQSLFRDRTLVDRSEEYDKFCQGDRSYHDLELFEMQAKRRVDAVFNTLLAKHAEADIKKQKGIFCFYFENWSKASYFVEGGALATIGNPEMIVTYVVAPTGVHLTPKQAFLEAKELLVHELAHCFFINHNYARAFEPAPPQGTFQVTELPEHVEHDTCVMNYDPDETSQQFCGKCVLRLRGWRNDNMSNQLDYALAEQHINQDIAAAGANNAWHYMRLAIHRRNGDAMKEATKKADKKREDFKWDRIKKAKAQEPWKSVIARLKELDAKKKDGLSKKEEAELLNLNRRNDEIDASVRAPLNAILEVGTLANNEVRQAGRPVVAAAELAFTAFSSSNGMGPGLPINMLRNMVLVHAKFGDAEKARDYYRRLSQLATHGLDLTGGNPLKDIYQNSPRHQVEALDDIDTSYYEVQVEVGDIADLFANTVGTDAGRKARLQVLGLFNRPLDHPQSDDCLTFSWAHAKRLFNTLQDGDPGNVLDAEIKKFLVGTANGKLPMAGEPAARLRVAAGYGPQHSQTEMKLKFPEWDYTREDGYQEGEHDDEKPYSKFMLGADPYTVEDAYWDANPAMGKIPLKIKVRKRPVTSDQDGDFVAAANVRLYMQLVEPDQLDAGTFSLGTGAANPVAGGTSYSKGAEPVALLGKPSQYLQKMDELVNATHPSAPGDPQAFNKSAHVGGKGRLRADGNVTDPNPDIKSEGGKVRENLLLSPAGGGTFAPFPELADSKSEPHTITFDTDGNGEAKVVFAPSRIGGDRYKFRFYVGRPTMTGKNDSNITETATVVVWRTARISRYLKMEPHTNPGEIPAYLQGQETQPGAPDCLKAVPAALTDIDFSADVTKELARCYVECVVEPLAQASADLTAQSAAFKRYVRQLAATHPWFVNCTFSQRYHYYFQYGGKFINPKTGAPLADGEKPYGGYKYENSAAWLSETIPGTGKDGTAKTLQAVLRWTPFASSLKLVEAGGTNEATGLAECSIDKPSQMVGVIPLTVKDPLESASFDYATRQLTLTFKTAAGAKAGYTIFYQGRDLLDLDAFILDFPATSPFLFNLRLPADYNRETQRLHPNTYVPMAKADQADFFANRPSPFVGYLEDRYGGLVKTILMEALAKSVDGNGGYIPGITVVQAVELDPWGGAGLQEGKAVGRTVYLFNGNKPGTPLPLKILIHEISHALYLQHAPGVKGARANLHDPADACIMNYDAPVNDGDYCGQCVAALRGMDAGDEPFVPKPKE
jgi:hypothetical protein